jgi:hypothetical protein
MGIHIYYLSGSGSPQHVVEVRDKVLPFEMQATAKDIVFSLHSAKTALASTALAKGEKDTIEDCLKDAETGVARLLTQQEEEKKMLTRQLQNNPLAAATAATMHGALSFSNGRVSLTPLPKGTADNFKTALDILDRVPMAAAVGHQGRFRAYAELFALQATFQLTEPALWIVIVKAPGHVRELLAVAPTHSDVHSWFKMLSGHLDNTPVDRFNIFSASRGTDSLMVALKKMEEEHHLTLLAGIWPTAMIKDFILSDRFLAKDYIEANSELIKALKASPKELLADLALEAERFFRLERRVLFTPSIPQRQWQQSTNDSQ